MILVALCVLLQQQTTQAELPAPKAQTASALISKMFLRYSSAKTVSGRITLVQTALTASLEVDTAIAFEKPSLFYLDQRETDNRVPEAKIVSDGVHFSYPSPAGLIGSQQRLLEPVHKPDHDETVQSIYGAGGLSLIDKTTPLAMVMARLPDLRAIVEQLASFTLKGKVRIGERDANWISGQWRDDATKPISALFDIYIGDDGDLVRYVNKKRFRIGDTALVHHHLPPGAYPNGVEVVSTWDVDIAVNQPIDHSIFRL